MYLDTQRVAQLLRAKEKQPNIPVPPDQGVPEPVEEPPDRPHSEPDAPVREPGPEPPQHLQPSVH